MYDLEKMVKAEGRIRNTTQGVFDRIRTTTVTGASYVSGTLEADDYWKWVGNGRGPGGMPPVEKIQDWLDRIGSRASAYVIARRIGAEGSRAYREKGKNVFLSAADKWERSGLQSIEQTAQNEMEDAAFEVVRNIQPWQN